MLKEVHLYMPYLRHSASLLTSVLPGWRPYGTCGGLCGDTEVDIDLKELSYFWENTLQPGLQPGITPDCCLSAPPQATDGRRPRTLPAVPTPALLSSVSLPFTLLPFTDYYLLFTNSPPISPSEYRSTSHSLALSPR
jgi:hypothetical protein